MSMAKGAKDIPCQHWNDCGGCPLIRIDYPKQLRHKFDKVKTAFVQAGFDPLFLKKTLKPTRASPNTLGYRNKAKWILQFDNHGHLKMGIYRPGTHDVVDIPHCAVHAPLINEISLYIKDKLIEEKVRCASSAKGGALRYMIVRHSFREKKLMVVFVTSGEDVPGLDRVVRAVDAKYSEKIVSIVQNINQDSGNVLLGEANKFLKKKGDLTENLGSFRVPVGPLSFLQVNTGQAGYLYKRVKELIGSGPYELGLDLYSGVGLIAMHLASVTKKILAVEEVGPAALEGMTTARRNRIHNVLELCSDALDGVNTFLGEWGAPDWVVLNPPRKGCDEQVLAALASRPPRKLVYVSCNPVTLARDIHLLQAAYSGFELKTLEPVDMFPQTEHVECIALLENKNFKENSSKVSEESGRSKLRALKNKARAVH